MKYFQPGDRVIAKAPFGNGELVFSVVRLIRGPGVMIVNEVQYPYIRAYQLEVPGLSRSLPGVLVYPEEYLEYAKPESNVAIEASSWESFDKIMSKLNENFSSAAIKTSRNNPQGDLDDANTKNF